MKPHICERPSTLSGDEALRIFRSGKTEEAQTTFSEQHPQQSSRLVGWTVDRHLMVQPVLGLEDIGGAA